MIFLQTQQVNPLLNFLPIIGIFVVFYFFFIRPQQKKAKEQNTFIANINKGDDVVTASGIIGKINKIEGEVVTLQIDQKTFIRVTKSSISKEMTEGTKVNA
ncbi:MAG: preprotein translocase subunit YajC [Saprospiraceae bacterium]|nr:preprotein translocase subunit YajC [Saprospiraceae bacterium]